MPIECWQCEQTIEPLWDHDGHEWYCPMCNEAIDVEDGGGT